MIAKGKKAWLVATKKGVNNFIDKDNCSYNFNRTLKLTTELTLAIMVVSRQISKNDGNHDDQYDNLQG